MSEQKLETKKLSPLHYRTYDRLCEYHCGAKTKTTVNSLCEVLLGEINANNRRTMRKVLTDINLYGDFDKIVCRVGGVYVASNEQESKAYINATRNRGLIALTEAWKLQQKQGRNGQGKIAFGDYFKEYCETFDKKD